MKINLKKWWHGAVCYQIYPKSFSDTNDDGIGDLPGIIDKLDYLKELGVDIVWLSPIYASPLADQGYDISDYRSIDPRFGTMKDMETLLSEAHKRDMHILMDLVVNHCSDEHEWFKKACEDPEGRYGKYFYIEDLKDGKVPTNWRSYFGGSVWEPLPGHPNKVYLHVFHKKQPDLNWENPILREEIYDMVNWWLDKGLDGFRLDAIINIKKALPFRDYETDRNDNMAEIGKMLHEADGIGEFLSELRDRCFKPHNAFTVGEVFNEDPDEIPDFIGENGYFSSMYDFAETIFGQSQLGWYSNSDITPEDYKRLVFETQEKVSDIGFISNIIENHDEPRGVNRYIPGDNPSDTAKKMLATAYFFLRGLPWIYQGQEIGMENIHVTSIDEVDDISARDNYKVALEADLTPDEAIKLIEKYSRDNARTPFQWDGSKNAGFTRGTPWLRVNPNFERVNLAAEREDPLSVFNYYKQLTALRKDPKYIELFTYGEFKPTLKREYNIMGYKRELPETGQAVLVVANFSDFEREIMLPEGFKNVILCNTKKDPAFKKDHDRDVMILEPFGAVVLEKQ